MIPTRETVFGEVFDRFAALEGTAFKVVSRRMILPDKVQPGYSPTLRIWEQVDEYAESRRGLPPSRIYHCDLVIYFINNDVEVPGASILNPLIDAVEGVIRPDDPRTNAFTLGGLVDECWIESGQIVKETGDTDPKGLGGAVIPLAIRLGVP